MTAVAAVTAGVYGWCPRYVRHVRYVRLQVESEWLETLLKWSAPTFGYGADLILLGTCWSSVIDVAKPPVVRCRQRNVRNVCDVIHYCRAVVVGT